MYRLIQKFHLDRYLSSKLVLLIDSAVSVGSTLLAYLLVRSLVVSSVFSVRYGLLLLLGSLIFSVLSFYLFGTQRTIIRHTTLREMWKLVAAVALKDALLFAYVFWVLPHDAQTGLTAASLGFMIDILLTLFLLLSMRLMMIVLYDLIKYKSIRRENCKRVLVYGTGDKSVALIGRLQNSPHYRIVGFLTYGKRLKNHILADYPVYYFETNDNVKYLQDRYDIDAVLFATNDEAQHEQERLIRHCTEDGLKVLIAPPIDEVIDGKLMKQPIREIKIEDLLGREEI